MCENVYDMIIVGSGPAGLTAGIYAARAGAQVLILEHGLPGGQAALTAAIDNYPGLPHIDGGYPGEWFYSGRSDREYV